LTVSFLVGVDIEQQLGGEPLGTLLGGEHRRFENVAAPGGSLGVDFLVEVKQYDDRHFDASGLGVDDRNVPAVYPASQRGVGQAQYLGGQPPADGRPQVFLHQDACGGEIRVSGVPSSGPPQPD